VQQRKEKKRKENRRGAESWLLRKETSVVATGNEMEKGERGREEEPNPKNNPLGRSPCTNSNPLCIGMVALDSSCCALWFG